MRTRAAATVFAATASLLVLGAVAAVPSGATGGRTFVVALTGAAERPGPGDPDGSGVAEITVNPGQREVCWTITYSNLDPVVGAHIHRAPAEEPGPVVVPFSPVESGCATADRDLLVDILVDPSAYYVNVHTTQFRPGAIRGQMER